MKIEVDFDEWLTLNKRYGEARGILGAWLCWSEENDDTDRVMAATKEFLQHD